MPRARPALLLALLLALLAPPPALAHAAQPPAEWAVRMLHDQNDDAYVWGLSAGHDLVALDVDEEWDVTTAQPMLVFKLIMNGGYTPADPPDPNTTLRADVNFTLHGQRFGFGVSTVDNNTFTGPWDRLEGPNDEGDGGRFSLKLALVYSRLAASVGDVLSQVSVASHRLSARRDVMVGGAYDLNGQLLDSAAEAEQPTAFDRGSYTLRGTAYWLGLAAESQAVQVAPGSLLRVNLTVTNRLQATHQFTRFDLLGWPAGWDVSVQRYPFMLCPGCSATYTLNLSALANATTGPVSVQARTQHGGRDALEVRVELPPPPGTLLEVRDVRADAGVDRAVVRWNTTLPADGQVEWGPTSGYGANVTEPAPRLAHEVALTGLAPATPYHFRVTSTADGQHASSADATFTTLPVPVLVLTRPAEGAELRGAADVRVAVEHWTGTVELRLDDRPLASLGPPYRFTWNTRGTRGGAHVLQAWADAWASAPLNVTVRNPAGEPSSLAAGKVDPSLGDTNARYRYTIAFTDPDGDLPSRAEVLVDGQPRPLQGGGDTRLGATYALLTNLSLGRHAFAFEFETAEGVVRFPDAGVLPGPLVVEPQPGPPPPDLHGKELPPISAPSPAPAPAPAPPRPTPGLELALVTLLLVVAARFRR